MIGENMSAIAKCLQAAAAAKGHLYGNDTVAIIILASVCGMPPLEIRNSGNYMIGD